MSSIKMEVDRSAPLDMTHEPIRMPSDLPALCPWLMIKVDCKNCKSQFERMGSEDWRKLCTVCYKDNSKKCQTCKTNNISLSAPSWSVDCNTCWLQKKAATHDVCPECPPALSTHLRRKKGQPACRSCMVTSAFQSRMSALGPQRIVP